MPGTVLARIMKNNLATAGGVPLDPGSIHPIKAEQIIRHALGK
jgi:hypothetical protein